MKIKEAEILNYRSCIKTKFELQNNLTALIGINGVGKSNILNALLLLKRIKRSRRYYGEEQNDSLQIAELNLTLELQETLYLLRSRIYYETDEKNTDDVFKVEMKYRKKSSPRSWYKIESDLMEVAEFMNRRNLTEVPKDKIFQSEKIKLQIKLLQHLSKVNYYSATQFSDPSKCPVSFELEDGKYARSFRSQPHELFMYELYSTFINKRDIFDIFLNTVNSNGVQIIDDLSFIEHEIPTSSYKVRAGGKIEKIEKVRKIIIPSVFIDELTLSPNQLSEGTFKTLALVFYIINDTSELLLIEEPEVCVHHGLLNSIIELIKTYSREKQIIISTHSDFVLDKLKPENILLIKKRKGTKAENLTKSLTKNEYEVLKNYLENTGNLGEYWKEGGFEDE